MTNKEKKEYIRILAEYNRQCYMNGEKDNIIGKFQFKVSLITLKITLQIKRNCNFTYRNFTKYPIND